MSKCKKCGELWREDVYEDPEFVWFFVADPATGSIHECPNCEDPDHVLGWGKYCRRAAHATP